MIVTCECDTCLLKDLCINRNRRLEKIEGHEFFFVNLICKHKHPNKEVDHFDCNKCKNKIVCKVHSQKLISADIILATSRADMKRDMKNKLPNADAFDAVLCCKGYMKE